MAATAATTTTHASKFPFSFHRRIPPLSRLRQQGPGLFQQPFAVNNGVAAPSSVAEYASFAVQLKEPGSIAVDAYDLHRVLPQLPWKDISAVPPSLCLPKQVIEGVTGILVYLTGNILQRLSHIDILDFVVLPLPRGGEGDTTPQHMLPSLPRRTPAGFSTSFSREPPPLWLHHKGTALDLLRRNADFPRLFLTYVQNRI